MSRSERLLALLQVLRRYRRPVSGQVLAGDLGISIRTLYRDIASLQAQGAGIEGEPGVGYVLRPGFTLPPLMFSDDEIEALGLGSRFVAQRGDGRLSAAAIDAWAKITAVLPPHLRDRAAASPLLVGPGATAATNTIDLADLRDAIRAEHRLTLAYSDGRGASSRRVIWPLALTFFDRVQVVVAWCEMRGDFRHFRTDRIVSLGGGAGRYPGRRQALLKAWREAEGIPPPT